jgi:hypothetical protein
MEQVVPLAVLFLAQQHQTFLRSVVALADDEQMIIAPLGRVAVRAAVAVVVSPQEQLAVLHWVARRVMLVQTKAVVLAAEVVVLVLQDQATTEAPV